MGGSRALHIKQGKSSVLEGRVSSRITAIFTVLASQDFFRYMVIVCAGKSSLFIMLFHRDFHYAVAAAHALRANAPYDVLNTTGLRR